MNPFEGNKLRILKLLEKKPRRFNELENEIGLSKPVISKHLRNLQKQGLVFRNSERMYGLVAKSQAIKPNIEIWDSADLLDIRTVLNWVGFWKSVPTTKIGKKLRFDLTFYFFQGTIGSILANTTKAIDDAAEAKNVDQVQEIIKRFIESYLTPVLHLLAIEVHSFPRAEIRADRRPFEDLESYFSERAITAQLEFMRAYKKLEKILSKEPSALTSLPSGSKSSEQIPAVISR